MLCMAKLIIHGINKPLEGDITIAGAKNAALPILAATLLSSEAVTLNNVPRVDDVLTMLELLRFLGMRIDDDSTSKVALDAKGVSRFYAPTKLVTAMRASVLVLGPLLARHGHADIALPGGCAIGTRPVDFHIKALQAMGADIWVENGYIKARNPKGRLQGETLSFDKVTVTGTENILMAAVLAQGTTVIRNAAREPEVCDLIHFLNSMGARIGGVGSDTLKVEGVDTLHGGNYNILPDRIEAGTYLTAAALTRGRIKVKKVRPATLSALLDKLHETGADITQGKDWVDLNMHGQRPRAVDICTAPYPAIPTDMQAPLMALNTVAQGQAVITETIFENRFKHVQELQRMGANIQIDGNRAHSTGVERLNGVSVVATDLRASASLILAGLVAKGKTAIEHIAHVDRGYECIEEKFALVGAHIERMVD